MSSHRFFVPEEVLLLIFESVADAGNQGTLASVCRSSKTCDRIASGLLYRDFHTLTSKPAACTKRLHKFLRTLRRRPSLRVLVRSFRFTCEGYVSRRAIAQYTLFEELSTKQRNDLIEYTNTLTVDDSEIKFPVNCAHHAASAMVAALYKLAPSLESLELGTKWLPGDVLGAFVPHHPGLRALKRLSLGSSAYPLDLDNALLGKILDLPSLESLTMWNSDFSHRNNMRLSVERRRPLRSLVLRQTSRASALSLLVLLSLGLLSGLQSFTLELGSMDGQSTYFEDGALGVALSTFGDSLQFIEVSFAKRWYCHPQDKPAIRDITMLQQLKKLVVPAELLLGNYHKTPTSVWLNTALPTQLETLVLTGETADITILEQVRKVKNDNRFAALVNVQYPPWNSSSKKENRPSRLKRERQHQRRRAGGQT